MQSIVNIGATTAVVVFSYFADSIAAIVQVPSGQPTIQAALDAISENDTILVSQGTYSESLIAPDFGFALIGDVDPDTGLYQRPIVDPSALDSAWTRSCLSNLYGNVVIERMWFRNGASMFPHTDNSVGGLWNQGADLTIRDCVFDSTFRGVVSIGADVSLERCVFIRSVRHCVRATSELIARDCIFECVDNEWATVLGGTRSLVERCQWQGDMGPLDWWLCIFGDDWEVRNNMFGPGGGSRQELIRLGGWNGVFEYNTIQGCLARGALMSASARCGGTIDIRNNNFADNLIQGEVWAGTMCLSISSEVDTLGYCAQIVVDSNAFVDNSGGSIVKAIRSVGNNIISRNTFRRLRPEVNWSILVGDGRPTFRDNLLFNNGKSVQSEYGNFVHAEYNYWGHASGPFHAMLNPLGQGDEVGDSVDFDPWYTDTLFNIESVEPRAPLPETASLVAFPNPFNAVTTLRLSLPRAGIARVELFDITGRKLQELWSGAVGETREIQFDGTNFASGMYFVRAWDPLGNRLLAAAKLVLLK